MPLPRAGLGQGEEAQMGTITGCIKNGKIVLADRVLEHKVLVFGTTIVDLIDQEAFESQNADFKDRIRTIDAAGNYVAPGFIDVHIHGCGGKDTMDGEAAALAVIQQTVAKSGVTGFLPTTITMDDVQTRKALHAIRLAMKEPADGGPTGASVLGVHMEGPFLSPHKAGAQNKAYIRKPDFSLIQDDLDLIKVITFAPEEDADFRFLKQVLANSNIILSMGHTNADYETAMRAIHAGVRHATHLFNAMPTLHHRKPGAVGAALGSDISFELIADTLHVHPALFPILLNAKGKDKMILITDSIRAGGMGDGVWDLGGQQVTVTGRAARLADGTLAGSVLTLNEAVYHLLSYTDLTISEAVALASLNPARLIGMDEKKGSIQIGKDADLVVFDEQLQVQLTILEGRVIYSAQQGSEA